MTEIDPALEAKYPPDARVYLIAVAKLLGRSPGTLSHAAATGQMSGAQKEGQHWTAPWKSVLVYHRGTRRVRRAPRNAVVPVPFEAPLAPPEPPLRAPAPSDPLLAALKELNASVRFLSDAVILAASEIEKAVASRSEKAPAPVHSPGVKVQHP